MSRPAEPHSTAARPRAYRPTPTVREKRRRGGGGGSNIAVAGTAEEPKDKLMGFCGGSAPSSPIALLVLAHLGLTDTLGGTKTQLYEAGRIKDKGLGLL